jgi:hypothetical protein
MDNPGNLYAHAPPLRMAMGLAGRLSWSTSMVSINLSGLTLRMGIENKCKNIVNLYPVAGIAVKTQIAGLTFFAGIDRRSKLA